MLPKHDLLPCQQVSQRLQAKAPVSTYLIETVNIQSIVDIFSVAACCTSQFVNFTVLLCMQAVD